MYSTAGGHFVTTCYLVPNGTFASSEAALLGYSKVYA
jgi:hypothetical protein